MDLKNFGSTISFIMIINCKSLVLFQSLYDTPESNLFFYVYVNTYIINFFSGFLNLLQSVIFLGKIKFTT